MQLLRISINTRWKFAALLGYVMCLLCKGRISIITCLHHGQFQCLTKTFSDIETLKGKLSWQMAPRGTVEFCFLNPISEVPVVVGVVDENMLRTPAHHSQLHLLVHFVTDVQWKHSIKHPSMVDALCSVVHFQCGTEMCIKSMHAQLSASCTDSCCPANMLRIPAPRSSLCICLLTA